jgi:AraC-like DNA-binding protein
MVKLIALLSPMYVTLFWGVSFLLQKNINSKATQILSAFMFTAFMLYFCHLLYFIEQYELYSFFDGVYIQSMLSLYPLFYFYVRSLSSVKFEGKKHYLHFLPAFVLGMTSLILNFFMSSEERISYVKDLLINRNLSVLNFYSVTGVKAFVFVFSRIIFIGHTVLYLVLGIKLASRHNQQIIQFYSNIERRDMNWIKSLSRIYLGVSAIAIIFSIVGRSYFAHNSLTLIIPSVIFTSIYFVIGFNGSRHISVSEDIIDNEHTFVEFEEINHSEENKLKKQLLKIFEKDKIYIHPDLRITTIAEVLRTNRTYISRLINDDFGMNFNEFVNKYRIAEAERLLNCEDHQQYTLEFIAEKSGFGNTNSFTRSFKEFNGITPGQYRLKCQKKTVPTKT